MESSCTNFIVSGVCSQKRVCSCCCFAG